MARSKPPELGSPKSIPVTLSSELAIDLWVYQQANSGALQGQVVCDALAFFLKERLKENPQMEHRFNEIKARLLKPTANVVKLLDPVRAGEPVLWSNVACDEGSDAVRLRREMEAAFAAPKQRAA